MEDAGETMRPPACTQQIFVCSHQQYHQLSNVNADTTSQKHLIVLITQRPVTCACVTPMSLSALVCALSLVRRTAAGIMFRFSNPRYIAHRI